MPTPAAQVPVNRTLVGILAIVLTSVGVLIGWLDSIDNVWCGSFVRTGVLLGVFWLALPSRRRAAAWANVSPWTFIAVLAMMVVLVRRPQIFFGIAALLAIATLIIRPRPRT